MSTGDKEAAVVVSLHHLQVAMPAGGEGTARLFYGELLGLDEVPKPERLAKRGGCWFRGPELELHLGVESDFRPARNANVEIIDDTQLDGHERFYAFDPFGNRLEFVEKQTHVD
jgi:extradiol dioxygenase family protein